MNSYISLHDYSILSSKYINGFEKMEIQNTIRMLNAENVQTKTWKVENKLGEWMM